VALARRGAGWPSRLTRALTLISAHGAVAALAMALEGSDEVVETFRLRAERLDVERDLEIADRAGARVVCPGDEDWPSGVDDLDAPPICLWVRGPADLSVLARRSVAVVGARSCTSYGDHRGALAVDGVTVAVLAGGVDRAYPVAHDGLLRRIVETGAIISEVAPAPRRRGTASSSGTA